VRTSPAFESTHFAAAARDHGQSTVAIHLSFPPILGYGELAQLLKRTPASLQADFSRKRASLPPAYLPQGTKQPLWILTEVIAWLAKQPAKTPSRTPIEALSARTRRGAPTKADRIARQRAVGGA
jgi:hypothetical protein